MREPTPLRPEVVAAWPTPPNEAVYHGLVGEIVRTLDPTTEADPVGVLVSLLAGVGNVIGTGPHLILDNARHGLRVWPILVGPTGTGRKGTALAAAGTLLGRAFPEWWESRGGGLSTGEGVIWEVRDPIIEREPIRDPKTKTVLSYQDIETDSGVTDKRKFLVESEFGGVLQVITRDKNTLSAVLRKAWDGDPLTVMTKANRIRSTGAHLTITGHITPEEVRELLAARELSNGLGNRFLWICVRRSKLLPFGGQLDEGALVGLSSQLRAAVDGASEYGLLTVDEEASTAWGRVYSALANDEPGVVGQLASRGAPTIMRLAGIYAALDESPVIRLPHLEAALALWEYSESSIRHVFGAAAIAPVLGAPYRRRILDALATGRLTQTAISDDVFNGNVKAADLHTALDALLRDGLVACAFERPPSGKGRNITWWEITDEGRTEVAG